MTIVEAGRAIRRGEITCEALTRRCLARIEEFNPVLNAFITVTADAALSRARELDSELARGKDRGPLHGIPVAHKDLVYTRGTRTTCGSKLFADFVPGEDAAVVERLEAAGAVSVGKTGLHELAYGITCDNPHFGPIRNPADRHRIPGGSSGGSGVAVATGMALAAIGTDTGGSIRIPAAFCGVAGLKPTYGLVSCYGIQPLGYSLDHAGPLCVTSRDAGLVLEAIAGPDPRDAASSLQPAGRYAPQEKATIEGLRVGIPDNDYFERLMPEVESAVRAVIARIERLGARIQPVRTPAVGDLNLVSRVVLYAEASAVYRQHIGRTEMFGADVLTLLQQGLHVSGPDYVNAQRLRRRLAREYREVFREVDLVLTPSAPATAPLIGQKEVVLGGSAMDVRLAATSLVRGINVTGLPALSVPCHTKGSLPVGVQLIGAPFGEDVLVRAGAAVEESA